MDNLVKKVDDLSLNGNLAENWRRFKMNFEIFETASGISEKPDAQKIAIFLNAVGSEAVDLYNTFEIPDEDRMEYAKVKQAFENYFTPKKNVVFERFQFNKRNQYDDEPFDNFLMDIRRLVKSCEYEDSISIMRDRIVMGIADLDLQERMLEVADLSFQKAVDMCKANESSRDQARQIQEASTRSYNPNRNSRRYNKRYPENRGHHQPNEKRSRFDVPPLPPQ